MPPKTRRRSISEVTLPSRAIVGEEVGRILEVSESRAPASPAVVAGRTVDADTFAVEMSKAAKVTELATGKLAHDWDAVREAQQTLLDASAAVERDAPRRARSPFWR